MHAKDREIRNQADTRRVSAAAQVSGGPACSVGGVPCLSERHSVPQNPRELLRPSHPHGTLIRGEFGHHRGAKGYMTFWIVFCAVLLAGFCAAVIRDIATGRASAESTPYLGVVIGALLLVLGWGLRRVGAVLGAGQRTALENFLRSRLEAQETEERNAVIYKGFEILPASRKPPGQNRWRLEFILKKYNEKGEITLEKTCIAENFFKTKKKADSCAIGLAKLIINKEVPSAILEDT